MAGPLADIVICWAGYPGCSVNWDALNALLATGVGAAAVYAAVVANKISHRQMLEAERSKERLLRAHALQLLTLTSSAHTQLGFAAAKLNAAKQHADKSFQRKKVVESLDHALAAVVGIAQYPIEAVADLPGVLANWATAVIATTGSFNVEFSANRRVVDGADLVSVPGDFIDGMVRGIEHTMTAYRDTHQRIAKAFQLPDAFKSALPNG